MNFNVYLDHDTVARLERLARARQTTRNRLIRDAVGLLLERQSAAAWPPEVLEFTGDAGFPRFERRRRDRSASAADPLA